ncbi:MAG: hypothetical protein JWP59_2227 [Massilia sp.]|nr:hypothetical protein [Massilia sp.]
MNKYGKFKKNLALCLLVLGSLTVATDALACKRFDIGCKIREAAQRAREQADAEAQRVREAAQRAQQQAAQAAQAAQQSAQQAAQQAAAKAAADAAAARAVADALARQAQAEALRLAAQAQHRLPIKPAEVLMLASRRADLVANTAQGTALNAQHATLLGMNRVGSDINGAFKNAGDDLEKMAKQFNIAIPDVASLIQSAMQPPLSQIKAMDAYRKVVNAKLATLSTEDMGVIWSVMRSVMARERPSDDDIDDLDDVMVALFGDVTNGCAICPSKPTFSSVGFGITITSPGIPQTPVAGTLGFDLMMSTYPVNNGRPLFVAGYSVAVQATAQPPIEPDISIDIKWAQGQLSANKIPQISMGLDITTPGMQTQYGAVAGAGGVSLTLPNSVFIFLDKGERNKLVAALKDPSKGPAFVTQAVTTAMNDLKTMFLNPGYGAGVSLSPPGAGKLKALAPDGALSTSIAGSIISF